MVTHSTLAVQMAPDVDARAEPRLVRIDGVAGTVATLDTPADGSTASDLAVVMELGCVGWLPGANVALAGHPDMWVAGLAPGGRPYLYWRDSSGQAHTCVATVAVPWAGALDYRQRQLRWQLDVNDGAAGNQVVFSWRASSADDYTELEAITRAGTTSVQVPGSVPAVQVFPAGLSRAVGLSAADDAVALVQLDCYRLQVAASLAGAATADTGDTTAAAAGATDLGDWTVAPGLDASEWVDYLPWLGADGTATIEVTRGRDRLLEMPAAGSWQLNLLDTGLALADLQPMRHVRLCEAYDDTMALLARGYGRTFSTLWAAAGQAHIVAVPCTDATLLLAQRKAPKPIADLMARLQPDHWWRLNETAGTAAADSGYSDNTATGVIGAEVALAAEAYTAGGVERGAVFSGDGVVSVTGAGGSGGTVPTLTLGTAAVVDSALAAEATLPAHTAGDLLVAFLMADAATGVITFDTAGWTELFPEQSGNSTMLWAWSKVAASDAEANPAISMSSNEDAILHCGKLDSDGLHVAAALGATTTSGSVTTSTDNCLIVRLAATDGSGNHTWASSTEVYDQNTPSGGVVKGSIATAPLATAGAAGTEVVTPTSGTPLTATLAFEPIAPTGSVTTVPLGDCTVAMFVRPQPTSEVAAAVRTLAGPDAGDAFLCALETDSDRSWLAYDWRAGDSGQQGGGVAAGGRLGSDGVEVLGQQADGVDRWRHLAFRRAGGIWTAWLDGRQWGRPYSTGGTPAAVSNTILLGGDTDTGGTQAAVTDGSYSILWVASSAPLGEWHGSYNVASWVADTLGHSVTYVHIASITNAAQAQAAAAGYDLVIIDSSCTTTELTNQFRNVATPVLSFEGHFTDDQGLGTAVRGTATSQTQITISNAGHDLAAGLANGNHTVQTSEGMDWITVANDVVQIAHVVGNSARTLIAGIEAGDTGTDGDSVPARRAHFYWRYDTSVLRNATAEALFEAAIDWCANVTPPAPPADTGTKQGASYEGGMAEVAIFGSALAAADIAQLAATRLGGALVAERTDLRVARLLDWMGWPADRRRIDTGAETMPQRTLAGGETVLQLLQECSAAEGGSSVVFVGGDGDVVFHSRLRRAVAGDTAQVKLGDIASHLADSSFKLLAGAQPTVPGDDLRTEVTATSAGGSGNEISRAVPALADRYGQRTLSLGELQHTTDATTAEHCTEVLNRLADPVRTVRTVLLDPYLDATLWATVMAIEEGQRLQVAVNPANDASAAARFDHVNVEGVHHIWGRRQRLLGLQVSDAMGSGGTIVGTSLVGVDTRPHFAGD